MVVGGRTDQSSRVRSRSCCGTWRRRVGKEGDRPVDAGEASELEAGDESRGSGRSEQITPSLTAPRDAALAG